MKKKLRSIRLLSYPKSQILFILLTFCPVCLQTVYRRLRCPAQPDKPTTPVSPSTSAPLLYTSSYLTRTNKYLGLDSVNPADFRGAATVMEKNGTYPAEWRRFKAEGFSWVLELCIQRISLLVVLKGEVWGAAISSNKYYLFKLKSWCRMQPIACKREG